MFSILSLLSCGIILFGLVGWWKLIAWLAPPTYMKVIKIAAISSSIFGTVLGSIFCFSC